ncbi:hypothetical protein [uncultured Paraglaciecola sp.]|uniref:hypothetical protein n=1 Tax=uncultured Paraglaciecola sp. TaxID=1765024 RepID=UPI0030D93EA3
MFENVHLSTVNNTVNTAPGLGYNVENYDEKGGVVAETTDLSATLVIDSDNVVTTMQGYSINVPSGGVSTTATLTESTLEANLNGYNGQWKDIVFSGLTLDAGMLSAVDQNGCSIDGVATNSGTKNIFSFDVNYSGCSKSGNYNGVLTLVEQNGVADLSWMAFDSDNVGVFGSVDTQITQDESLPLTNALKPSLYINDSKLMIFTTSEVYSLEFVLNAGSKNPFVFDYTYEPAPPFILGDGNGLIESNPIVDASLSIPVTPEMDSIDIEISYVNQSNVATTLNYSDLLYVSPELLLDSLEGQWGQLVIDANGILSGSANSCTLTGNINNYEEKIASVSISLNNCGQAGDYSGVIVGVESTLFGVTNNGIIAVLFRTDGLFSYSGIVGKSN